MLSMFYFLSYLENTIIVPATVVDDFVDIIDVTNRSTFGNTFGQSYIQLHFANPYFQPL
jgi:hypothetical protein